MNYSQDIAGGAHAEAPDSLTFAGEWREFLPIALTNLLLTLATLGIYRFWAKARERRYLWSRTHFIDDPLEWTGTGKEMLSGFLVVLAVLLPFLMFVNSGFQALVLRGEAVAATVIAIVLYSGIFYLYLVARFRALRYQLSRTFWHGIRGGSEEAGWDYGVRAFWRYAVGAGAMGMLIPWSMTAAWNMRWRRMSFGNHRFGANAVFEGLMGRWMLLYLVPVLALLLLGLGALALFGLTSGPSDEEPPAATVVTILAAIGSIYLIFLLLSLSYYALFYRKVAEATSLGGVLTFEFKARTKDWLKLILGNIALVIFTLGVGIVFLTYRNWSFRVRHLRVCGLPELSALAQSATQAPGEAEGLADAFDFGTI